MIKRAIEIDLNITAQRAVRVLTRIIATRGYPLQMLLDNRPELISLTLAQWAEDYGVFLSLSNLENRHRMRLLPVLITHTGLKDWIFICSEY